MANQSQNSGDPILCANNCGFYGNPATDNLCSKCYKDHIVKPKELKQTVLSTNGDDNKEELAEHGFTESVESGGSSSSDISSAAENNRAANRCNVCKKKVGLTGFKCRCGQTFCSMHRYSDKHNCAFDYKGAGQDAIARANPVVKAEKIDKI